MVKNYRGWFSWLAIIIVVSVILRIGLALYLGNDIDELRGGTYDQISYDALALRVSNGHGFSFENDWWPATRAGEPTAHWSYLYVLSLAGIYELLGHSPVIVRLLQALVVGILTPWLVYRIGRRTFNKNAGVAAAAIAAVYAYFIMYGATLMTEALYIVSILWSIDVSMRLAMSISDYSLSSKPPGLKRRLLLGLELGLALLVAILLRQVILAFVFVLILWLVWFAWRRASVRLMIAPLVMVALTVIVLISPVVIRNYRAFGRITTLNTNAGFAFFWSNHPIYGTRFESVLSPSHGVTYQELIPVELLELDEAALDRALLVRGLEFIRNEPGRYILLSLSRIPVYFLFWPKSNSTLLSNMARLLSFALFLPLMIYGVVAAIRRYLWPGIRETQRIPAVDLKKQSRATFEFVMLLLAFILTYTLVHILSWANVRYRLPVDAVLIVFAGFGVSELYRWMKSKRLIPATLVASDKNLRSE